jgi:hypothetical protein
MQEQELWTYAGIRQSGGKKIDCWLMIDGTEAWFPARGSHAVGHQYVVTVERGENGRLTKTDRDKYSNAPTEDVEGHLEGWTALHRAAQTELGRKAIEKKASQDDALDKALEPLLEMAAKVGSAQRAAFAAYVLHQLYTRGGWS